jgi:hypothetical protein
LIHGEKLPHVDGFPYLICAIQLWFLHGIIFCEYL